MILLVCLDCLKKWNYKKEEIDLIASHGQTIYHAPKFLHPDDKFPNATLQIGDGDIDFKSLAKFSSANIASRTGNVTGKTTVELSV